MKVAVTAWGRMNPPTLGHLLLIDKVRELASSENADPIIYVSHTHDEKTNPVPYDVKVKILNRWSNGIVRIDEASRIRTVFDMLYCIRDAGYERIVFVAGDDRIGKYEKSFSRYVGVTGDFCLPPITVVSAGQRDPDGDGVVAISGTKTRAAARAGDYEVFKKSLPSFATPADIKSLYQASR